MEDFWYYNPTKIIFGRNKVDEVGELVKPFGNKVLFIFGEKSIKQHGLYQRVKDRLRAASLQVIEHGGVKSNPRVSHVREGVTLGKQHKVDCVLAVGGGSVIDAAKAIAFGVLTEHDVWSFFTDRVKPEEALPICAVVTLAGSGSEASSGTVVTDDETSQKLDIASPCLIPKVSILDPALTLSVPRDYTVYGLIDTASHLMERYFNGERMIVPVQDRMTEGIILNLIEISRQLLADSENYEYRANVMWAASMAQNFLLQAGRGRVISEIHCLAHSLGALFDIPHGAAISVVLPAWMTFRLSQKLSKIAQFATRVMGVDEHLEQKELARTGIAEFKDWLSSIGGPVSLRELGVGEDALGSILENLAPMAFAGGMRDVNRKDIQELVKSMF